MCKSNNVFVTFATTGGSCWSLQTDMLRVHCLNQGIIGKAFASLKNKYVARHAKVRSSSLYASWFSLASRVGKDRTCCGSFQGNKRVGIHRAVAKRRRFGWRIASSVVASCV